MNTAQKYCSNCGHAIPVAPTAQNEVQTPPPVDRRYTPQGKDFLTNKRIDDWQVQFLKKAIHDISVRENLFAILAHAQAFEEEIDSTEVICRTMTNYSYDGRFVDSDEFKHDVGKIFHLLFLINKLHISFYCLDNACDFVNKKFQAEEGEDA